VTVAVASFDPLADPVAAFAGQVDDRAARTIDEEGIVVIAADQRVGAARAAVSQDVVAVVAPNAGR